VSLAASLILAAALHAAPLPPPAAAVSAATLERHRALVRRYYDQVWNQFHLDEANNIFAPPFDVEGIQETIVRIHYGIPDIHLEVHDILAEGELVAVSFTASGTHSAELFGGAPTGNKIRFDGMEIFQFKDGKIVAKHTNYDRMNLLRQLGALCKGGAPAP
jgi:predicted ester cyclase